MVVVMVVAVVVDVRYEENCCEWIAENSEVEGNSLYTFFFPLMDV